MTTVYENYPLASLNTFRVNTNVRRYVPVYSEEELVDFISTENTKQASFFILGGGSNILFTKNYNGTLIHPLMKGVDIIDEDESEVTVCVKAGENWDQFVSYAVSRGFGGIENLSGIPGHVGAAPVQNIGAYGVEVKDSIQCVETINILTKEKFYFDRMDCQFGYRSSIFKTELPNSHVVISVIFKLKKIPEFNMNYQDMQKEVEQLGAPSLLNIRNAVLSIRKQKLPSVDVLPNAGSFFKNPIVTKLHAQSILKSHPHLSYYPVSENHVKIPAAWLIEHAGYKGKKENNVGIYEKHALIIVNLNNASGEEIFLFSEKVRDAVRLKFNISLEREVHVI